MTRARIAHVVLSIVGLLIFLYPLTVGANPQITCRGVVLHPGGSCAKAQNGGVQTYEQRAHTIRESRPIVAGVGLLVAGFGAWLLIADLRRRDIPDG